MIRLRRINVGLQRQFNEHEREEFIEEMRRNGFNIIEDSQPDMRKPNTSGFLSKREKPKPITQKN